MARQYDVDRENSQFTRNWFRNRNLPTFREKIMPLFGGKPITYLEIGVFEGQSVCWMLQQVLTHPDSRAVCIDPHLQTIKLDEVTMELVRQRAIDNLWPWHDRCKLIRGNSAEVLRRMLGRSGYYGITRGSVDLAMVDGNHWALAVLDDCRQVIELLKPGGWMLMDDVENDRPKGNDHVKQGLAMFLAESGDRVKQVFKHRYMEGYERIK